MPLGCAKNSLQLLVSLSPYVLRLAFKHNLPAQTACIWSDIDQIVCGTHEFFVMLYDDDRIA